jgi:hypothetical protein
MSVAEITEVFDVTPEVVKAVLYFASESLARSSQGTVSQTETNQWIRRIPRRLTAYICGIRAG